MVEPLMTVSQLSKFLRISRSEIVMMTKACMIPAIDVSVGCHPKYRFSETEVMEALRTKRREKAPRREPHEQAGIEATFLV
jgi:excisionase family DNA binding protein